MNNDNKVFQYDKTYNALQLRERDENSERIFRKSNNEIKKNDQKIKKSDREDEKHD